MSKAETWRSNTDWRKTNTIGCRRWRPIWSRRKVGRNRRDGRRQFDLPPRQRPRRFRSSSRLLATRSSRATSPASTGRAATSPESTVSAHSSSPKGWGCCSNWSPMLLSMALMVNPTTSGNRTHVSDAQEAARTLGRQILVVNAGSASEIDAAFATLAATARRRAVRRWRPFFIGRRSRSSRWRRVTQYRLCIYARICRGRRV